ncbi:MAG TPA: hypothetical protein VHB97_08570 [Polyangia bacterium]|nr:hypothetical protein [Polyangia bacterium]
MNAARELLSTARMQDASDFSLPILVVLPERKVIVDEQASTTPFTRARLPGVDLRPAQERAAAAAKLPPAIDPAPLPAPRHAWVPSASGRHPVPSRLKARSLLGVPPPPPPRAVPLSDDDERRMLERVRAYRRMAWAQRLLERFQFADETP